MQILRNWATHVFKNITQLKLSGVGCWTGRCSFVKQVSKQTEQLFKLGSAAPSTRCCHKNIIVTCRIRAFTCLLRRVRVNVKARTVLFSRLQTPANGPPLLPCCLHVLMTPLSSLVFKFGAQFPTCDALPVLCLLMSTLIHDTITFACITSYFYLIYYMSNDSYYTSTHFSHFTEWLLLLLLVVVDVVVLVEIILIYLIIYHSVLLWLTNFV